MFAHLSPQERCWYLDRALAIGREQAGPYRGRPVEPLAAELGATVVRTSRSNRIAGLTIRAEYDTETRTITLYEPSMLEVQAALAHTLPEPWSPAVVADMHIAHELFHHLESVRIRPVHEQLPPVVTFRLGRFLTTRTRARRCREIAAHAFARELLGLPFLPNAVDYLILVATNRWSEAELSRALARAEEELMAAVGRQEGLPDPVTTK